MQEPLDAGTLSALARRLEAQLPQGTVVEATDPARERDAADPLELALVAGAVEKRVREFTAGRAAARRAVGRLGLPAPPLLADARRAPRWPADVVGSISHCDALCLVVAGHRRQVHALGVDVERRRVVSAGFRARITTPDEQRAFASLSDEEAVLRTLVVFSAKECFYKAQYPPTERFLEFRDVEVDLHDDGTFAVRPRLELPLVDGGRWRGRWSVDSQFVITTLGVATPSAGG